MRLLIDIVNYRTALWCIACLRSLLDEVRSIRDIHVVVADADSRDGSVEQINAAIGDEGWNGWVTVVPLERNGGFAFANNTIVRRALMSRDAPEAVLFLNPDTLVKPGAIRSMLQVLEGASGIGIVGSALENMAGDLEVTGHQMIRPLSELLRGARFDLLCRWFPRYVVSPRNTEQQRPFACEWVSGAAMMVRREVFEQIGLLDEGYFLYFDEVDFCFRAMAAGWQIWHVPHSRIVHTQGASTGIQEGTCLPACWFESRRRFFVKNYGMGGLILADICWAIGRLSLHARQRLRLGGNACADPKSLLFDILWRDAKAIMTGQTFQIKSQGDLL